MSIDPLGQALLILARNAIEGEFGRPARAAAPLAELAAPGAAFVTLTQNGNLRGCIGSLEAWRPLAEDVAANARAAAFRDPRFPALRREELEATRVEVSLLDAPEPMHFTDEADALAQLRPNVDGLILSRGSRRATFLPQVWESLATPRAFMEHLKLKAGLPANFWSADVKLARYGVRKWKEE
ncbi:MAG: AmmeMemoRadiSam system protein A [Candidatus Accumulibacter sp.]|jgi:AmmeMemoRadiSam system protein A|nr:AmmeMemoRadiSam system protein A [Accumulibacter sp.]